MDEINTLLEMQKQKIKNSKTKEDYIYSIGIYNGIEIIRAIFENDEPKFYKEEEDNAYC